MNIYEMYLANFCRYGFIVIRDSWGNTVAKITKIDGVEEGEIIPGKKPYFGNPPVIAEFYRIDDVRNKTEINSLCTSETLSNIGEISGPGTGGYSLLVTKTA